MAIQLLRLRGVPEDEVAELHALLQEHEVDYYETEAGNWGISMPALWLRDDADYARVRALLDDYQEARFRRVRAEYEELKRSGKARTVVDLLRENPVRFLLYLVLVGGLVYISTVPYLALVF